MWKTLGVCFLLIIVLGYVDGRGGGRGGGGRGGSRGSRSSSRSSRSSSVRTYRGPVYSRSSWKTAAAAGTLYGVMSYKRRHLYLSHPNREPRVCFNEKNLRNGTYGYFICPEPDQSDDLVYCCGDDDEQKCCTYSEYKRAQTIGAIVGGAIGGFVLIAFAVGVTVYCCQVKKRQAKAGKVVYHGNTQHVTTTSSIPAYSSNVYSTPADYNMQTNGTDDSNTGISPYDADNKDSKESVSPPAYGFKDNIATDEPTPPAYGFKDGTDGLPYPSNPNAGGPMDPNAKPPPYTTIM